MACHGIMALIACMGILADPPSGRITTGIPVHQSPRQQIAPGCSSPSGTAQEISADHVIDVRRYGARGDGVTNDTLAIRIAIRARKEGNKVLYLPPGTYLVEALDCSQIEDLTITGEGELSTLKRRTFSGTALLRVGNRATVRHLRLDGNKTSALGSPGRGDRGLVAADDCIIDRVISEENYGHGFRAEGNRNHFIDCVSEANGMNFGAYGTGDGYYVRDPWADNVFERCTANANARSGFVVTDMDAGCRRNQIISCTTDGNNGYNEVNLEGSTDSTVRACTIRGLLILNRAVHPYLFDNALTDGVFSQASIYGRGTVECRLAGNRIETSDSHERIHVDGTAPRVEHNSIRHSRPPARGYSLFVSGSAAVDDAVVVGNSVDGGCRGICVTGAAQCHENQTHHLADTARSLSVATVRGHAVSNSLNVVDIEIRDSQGIFTNRAPPATGTFVAGDICQDMAYTADKQSGWICVTGGTPGVWTAISH